MSNDINFLAVKNSEKARGKKGLKGIQIAAILSLMAIAFFSVLVFFLNRSIYPKSLKNERDSLLRSLTTLHNKEAKRAIIVDRIENISELLNKRVDYSKIVSDFSEKIQSNIKVGSFTIDKKTIVLTVSSNSLQSIDELINGLIDLGKNRKLNVLLLDSLSMSEASGTYSVSFTVSL